MNPDSITITINGVEHSIMPKATPQQATKRPLLEGAKIGSKWKTRGGEVATLHEITYALGVYPYRFKADGNFFSTTIRGTEFLSRPSECDILAPMPEEAEKPSTSTPAPAVVVTINGVEYGPKAPEIDKRLGDEYPYRPKVGDKVRFRPWDVIGDKHEVPCRFVHSMRHLCGTTATVTRVNGDEVNLDNFSATHDTGCWAYTRQMLELVEEAAKPAENPDVPERGSYWKHTDGDVYVATPDPVNGMSGWTLVDAKVGMHWASAGWDGDKDRFTPATCQDLIAYLLA